MMRIVSKSESVMQDHTILQRTLYKYEQTLTDLDGVLRGNNSSNEMIKNLKRIAEKQLKEIVMLQQEIDSAKYTSSQQNWKSASNLDLDNQVWS